MTQQFLKQGKRSFDFKTILADAILFVFIITTYISFIAFDGRTAYSVLILGKYLNSGILLLMFGHLCLSEGEWVGKALLEKDEKRALAKIAVSLALTALLAYFFLHRMPDLDIEPFYTVIGIYLFVFSLGRPFGRTAAVFLAAYAGIFLTACLGLVFGYTTDAVRFTDYGAKHTFGMVHPNTAAHILFIIVFCVWYLFLQKKKSAGWILFWTAAAFLAVFNRCRSIIFLLLAFPLLWRVCGRWSRMKNRGWERIVTAFPAICFGLSLLLCIPIHLIHRLTYGNTLFSIGERFVQAGMTIRKYGLPLIGHSIDTSGSIKMMVDGVKIPLFVVDNSYISYGVIRGLLWLIPCICILCLAIRLARLKSDNALVVFGILLCVFAILERRGLDPTFNLLFFYPLSVIRKGGGRHAEHKRRNPDRIRLG